VPPYVVRDDDEFLARWDTVVSPIAERQLKDGAELALLLPVAQHSLAATRLVRHIAGSDNYRQRKIAACLAGVIGPAAPASMLAELFEAEIVRDVAARPTPTKWWIRSRTTGDSFERLLCQSVVEDIVFAATRWAGLPQVHDAGVSVLRSVVTRTINGEYWNTAGCALVSLVHHGAPDADVLVERFTDFADGPVPDHPSLPSFAEERQHIERIRSGNVDLIEIQLRAQEDAAADVEWTPDTRAQIDSFLALARAVD